MKDRGDASPPPSGLLEGGDSSPHLWALERSAVVWIEIEAEETKQGEGGNGVGGERFAGREADVTLGVAAGPREHACVGLVEG